MDREIKENGHVMRNKRTVWEVAEQTVWEVATQRNPFNHFATFPESIVETCILAGCREGGLILDPFGGVEPQALWLTGWGVRPTSSS
jgi:DNA modification methylase